MAKGGARPGAGRKSKAEEQNLIEKLTPLEPAALKALKTALMSGEGWAVKLFMEYKFGRPTQKIDSSVKFIEQPLFNFDVHSNNSDTEDTK